jgi:monoamine oxidase
LLQATGALLGSAVAGLPRSTRAATSPRIAIVGGGLAGLRCAHKLWTDRGLSSTVYEWDSHVGGRVQTLRGFFANGQIVEQHGEFISSEHASMLALASRFGLALDLVNHHPSHTSDVYWFNGSYYTQTQLNADWKSFGWALFNNAVK